MCGNVRGGGQYLTARKNIDAFVPIVLELAGHCINLLVIQGLSLIHCYPFTRSLGFLFFIFYFLFFLKIHFRLRGKKTWSVNCRCSRQSAKSCGEKNFPFNFEDWQIFLEKKGEILKKF